MNIDELEKLARAAHDPYFPWIDRDALIGGLFAKGEIDYIAAAKPADILELIERVRELEEAIESIRIYGSDTLSGPVTYIENEAEWLREGIEEMVIRARAAMQAQEGS